MVLNLFKNRADGSKVTCMKSPPNFNSIMIAGGQAVKLSRNLLCVLPFLVIFPPSPPYHHHHPHHHHHHQLHNVLLLFLLRVSMAAQRTVW